MNAPLPVVPKTSANVGAPAIHLDPRTHAIGLTCVHCGLCLPSCPTYVQTGHEADSPRGRIQLMLGLAEGKFEATETVRKHLDLCLDCRGCETACPSGVIYHELIEETRAQLDVKYPATGQSRLMRWLFFNVLTHPFRLKLALLPARVLQKVGVYPLLRRIGLFAVLPASLRKMERMLPATGALWPRRLPEVTQSAARGNAKPPISFFSGCIGSVMFERVNQQAVELLSHCGATLHAPRSFACCGAIHLHSGDPKTAKSLAISNLKAVGPEGFIVTTIAGCGSMLREYGDLLRDEPQYREQAEKFSARVRDISEVLLEMGLPPMSHAVNQTATYHDACHLAHAQRVTAAPRKLLAMVPGLTMFPLPESDMCCGAAGTYNLTQPEMSEKLARRKLENIATTGAAVCVTGNVGCAMQIESEADAQGQKLRVVHPVEILHEAVFGKR